MADSKKEKTMSKIKRKILKKEEKILNEKSSEYIKNKITPIKSKVEEKIPDKMVNTFEKAFEKGFYYIFEKGTSIIEKSYNGEKIRDEVDTNKYILSKRLTMKNIKRFDKSANKGSFINSGITMVEGAGLGVLGIGLPDIPIFIGMILKSIYEICLSYDFNYDSTEEKIYILNIICGSVSQEEERRKYLEEADRVAMCIDNGEEFNFNFDEIIKVTSKKLVEKIMVSKFIQGIPIVGVCGGVSNCIILNKINKVAKIKYKKRFVNKIQL